MNKISFRYIKIDLLAQSFLVGLNLVFWLLSIVDFGYGILALYLLLFIGAYQLLVSALTHILIRKTLTAKLYELRQYHFFGSLIYLFFLVVFNQNYGWVYGFFLLIAPHFIGYAYFYLTYLDYKSRIDYLESRSTILAY